MTVAETLTTALLWTLAMLGGWNALGMIGRFAYGEPLWRYSGSVFLGIWAMLILLLRSVCP
jgi:hypothetical protein